MPYDPKAVYSDRVEPEPARDGPRGDEWQSGVLVDGFTGACVQCAGAIRAFDPVVKEIVSAAEEAPRLWHRDCWNRLHPTKRK